MRMTTNRETTEEKLTHLFLLENGHYAVSDNVQGSNLPAQSCTSGWKFIRTFKLDVQLPGPMNVDPEAIIRGLRDKGYHLLEQDGQPHGTSQ